MGAYHQDRVRYHAAEFDVLDNPAQACYLALTAGIADRISHNLCSESPCNYQAFEAFDQALYFPVGIFLNNAKSARGQRDTCVSNLNDEKQQHLVTKQELAKVKQE